MLKVLTEILVCLHEMLPRWGIALFSLVGAGVVASFVFSLINFRAYFSICDKDIISIFSDSEKVY